ncbi:protein IMPACT-like isoform X1 [Diprion similis]|uniref:protein IMPACT-like isoform X1 n=1 Tax=Diprion similis TaxID=362088 RepID=UPI001EF85F72|nr:protein IMPACT-like isoform X1 [Diprion similis]
MDDLSLQVDEIEALVAIYDKEWQTTDEENRAYGIDIRNENSVVRLHIKLPNNYPSTVSPTYEISAPHLSESQKNHIHRLLDEVCLANLGQNVIFQLVEKVREVLQFNFQSSAWSELESSPESEEITTVQPVKLDPNNAEYECPDILHGSVIMDRKSSFQGHAAIVHSVKQVEQVMHKLLENKKIHQATHNMYAYRIYRPDVNCFLQDCEDDGETQAGSRLLHLLQIMGVKDAVVIVSRWYGGIQLGPDRFRHINNAARQVLATGNLIPDKARKKV